MITVNIYILITYEDVYIISKYSIIVITIFKSKNKYIVYLYI